MSGSKKHSPNCRPASRGAPKGALSWSKRNLRLKSYRVLSWNQKTTCLVCIKASRLIKRLFFSPPVSSLPVSRSTEVPFFVSAGRRPKSFRRFDTVVHELGHHVGLDDDEMPY